MIPIPAATYQRRSVGQSPVNRATRAFWNDVSGTMSGARFSVTSRMSSPRETAVDPRGFTPAAADRSAVQPTTSRLERADAATERRIRVVDRPTVEYDRIENDSR